MRYQGSGGFLNSMNPRTTDRARNPRCSEQGSFSLEHPASVEFVVRFQTLKTVGLRSRSTVALRQHSLRPAPALRSQRSET